jgi:hypothetical protein
MAFAGPKYGTRGPDIPPTQNSIRPDLVTKMAGPG